MAYRWIAQFDVVFDVTAGSAPATGLPSLKPMLKDRSGSAFSLTNGTHRRSAWRRTVPRKRLAGGRRPDRRWNAYLIDANYTRGELWQVRSGLLAPS